MANFKIRTCSSYKHCCSFANVHLLQWHKPICMMKPCNNTPRLKIHLQKHTFWLLSISLRFSVPPSCRSRSRTKEGQRRTLWLLPNLHCQADVVRVFPAILVTWCTNWQTTRHEEASTYTISLWPWEHNNQGGAAVHFSKFSGLDKWDQSCGIKCWVHLTAGYLQPASPWHYMWPSKITFPPCKRQ